jgi:hypothetical protein
MRRRPHHVVTTVDLPSGRVLEVVQPKGGAAFTRVKAPTPDADRDLCLCERCDRDLVEPTDWTAVGPALWRVELYCPNCDHASSGVFSQECVDRFDERLDGATAAIVSDLKGLAAAAMAEDVERFIGALNSGAILPEDF